MMIDEHDFMIFFQDNKTATYMMIAKQMIKVEELEGDIETDGPTVTCSRSGDLVLAMRHFVSGRLFDCNWHSHGVL